MSWSYWEKKVVITSPSTLPPILATINMVRIQAERAKNVEIISKQLQKLSKDFEMFGREWDSFNSALESATKKREVFDNRVNKLTTLRGRDRRTWIPGTCCDKELEDKSVPEIEGE